MKKGFEDIVERYPHSAWDMNNFAAFACRAHDGDTYRTLRFRNRQQHPAQGVADQCLARRCEQRFPQPAL